MSLLIEAAAFQGDRAVGSILNFKFNVTNASGVLTTLTGTPTIACYKNNSTAESTAGLTLTVDFDAKTGLCNVTVDTSADATFYAADSDFEIVLTAGTVGVIDVSGTAIGHFSLAKCTANADVKKINNSSVIATAGILDVRLADGVPHGGTPGSSTATLALSREVIASQTTNEPAVKWTGNGTADGLRTTGGSAGGYGGWFQGGNNSGGPSDIASAGGGLIAVAGTGSVFGLPSGNFGIAGYGTEAGHGIAGQAGAAGNGIFGSGGSTSGHGIAGNAGDDGNGLHLEGGFTTGDGLFVSCTLGHGINAMGAGFGKHDINLAGSSDILGNLTGTINGLTAAGLATLFTVNSTKVYADAVTGSPVKEIGNILNRVMTESYAADGAAMTPAQALYEICQLLEERTISGTTLTIKKRDGVTTAFELTLDAVPPTTQTRSS